MFGTIKFKGSDGHAAWQQQVAPAHALQGRWPKPGRAAENPMMTHALWAYLYRLRYIHRWSLMRNITADNVAEHSFHVAVLAHTLAEISRTQFGRSVDLGLLLAGALFHDATEVLTGDIPTPVKHHDAQVLQSFRQIERMAADRLLGMVPSTLSDVYRPLLHQADHLPDDVVRLIKAADLLDAYLKCRAEISAGNREFFLAQQQIQQDLELLAMPEVAYFLKHCAPAYTWSLDEMERVPQRRPPGDEPV